MRVAVAVALVVCAVYPGTLARAAGAPGVKDARLSGIATAIVGKPTTVRCASDATIQALAGKAYEADGVTFPKQSTVYLVGAVCDVLGQVKGRPIVRTTWAGSSLLTFVHETWHMRGIADESDAECRALHEIGQVALQRFGVTNRKWLHDAIAQAWVDHRSLTSEYTRLC